MMNEQQIEALLGSVMAEASPWFPAAAASAAVQSLVAANQSLVAANIAVSQNTSRIWATRVPPKSPPVAFTLKKRRKRQTFKRYPFALTAVMDRHWILQLEDELDRTLVLEFGRAVPNGPWVRHGTTIYFQKREHASALALQYRGLRLDTPTK
jgi:hypothetical protein